MTDFEATIFTLFTRYASFSQLPLSRYRRSQAYYQLSQSPRLHYHSPEHEAAADVLTIFTRGCFHLYFTIFDADKKMISDGE